MMQWNKSSYFYNLLIDGAKPFFYRHRLGSLLGISSESKVMRISRPPPSFHYLKATFKPPLISSPVPQIIEIQLPKNKGIALATSHHSLTQLFKSSFDSIDKDNVVTGVTPKVTLPLQKSILSERQEKIPETPVDPLPLLTKMALPSESPSTDSTVSARVNPVVKTVSPLPPSIPSARPKRTPETLVEPPPLLTEIALPSELPSTDSTVSARVNPVVKTILPLQKSIPLEKPERIPETLVEPSHLLTEMALLSELPSTDSTVSARVNPVVKTILPLPPSMDNTVSFRVNPTVMPKTSLTVSTVSSVQPSIRLATLIGKSAGDSSITVRPKVQLSQTAVKRLQHAMLAVNRSTNQTEKQQESQNQAHPKTAPPQRQPPVVVRKAFRVFKKLPPAFWERNYLSHIQLWLFR